MKGLVSKSKDLSLPSGSFMYFLGKCNTYIWFCSLERNANVTDLQLSNRAEISSIFLRGTAQFFVVSIAQRHTSALAVKLEAFDSTLMSHAQIQEFFMLLNVLVG